MPFLDPLKRRSKALEYSAAYRERQRTENPSSCSQCFGPRDDTSFKVCSKCRAYLRTYKKTYRARPAPEGVCSRFPDCSNQARQGLRLCERCTVQAAKSDKRSPGDLAFRNQVIQEEVLAAYGWACVCCQENRVEFLSIDHVDGHREGPRSGSPLYRWLKRNNFPTGFRVLCMTCNFAFGHFGYCPHHKGGILQK